MVHIHVYDGSQININGKVILFLSSIYQNKYKSFFHYVCYKLNETFSSKLLFNIEEIETYKCIT
jgi:hypothetical protein